jgi:pyruvate/2-oxoglutarate/acetoin dehydrogenase E1 component
LLMDEEITCEVVIPSCIKPFDTAPVLESAGRSGGLIVFEEGTESWGWGREVVYQVAQKRPALAGRCISRGARDLPIGNSKPLEDAILPQVADIKAAVQDLCRKRSVS